MLCPATSTLHCFRCVLYRVILTEVSYSTLTTKCAECKFVIDRFRTIEPFDQSNSDSQRDAAKMKGITENVSVAIVLSLSTLHYMHPTVCNTRACHHRITLHPPLAPNYLPFFTLSFPTVSVLNRCSLLPPLVPRRCHYPCSSSLSLPRRHKCLLVTNDRRTTATMMPAASRHLPPQSALPSTTPHRTSESTSIEWPTKRRRTCASSGNNSTCAHNACTLPQPARDLSQVPRMLLSRAQDREPTERRDCGGRQGLPGGVRVRQR